MSHDRNPLVLPLAILAFLLACACVVGGVLVIKERQDRADQDPATRLPTETEQARYGEVKKAAAATVDALINIDYREPEASTEAIADTATGEFLEQYQSSSESLVELVTQYKSVLNGEVVSTAVSSLDPDSAVVLVATEGEVENAETQGEKQVRNFRLLVTLTHGEDGWRTNELEFVG